MARFHRSARRLLASSIVATMAFTFSVSPTSAVPEPPSDGWKLVWSDEFDGTVLDRTKWNVENYSTYGDGNKELACLMDRPQNVRVANGTLQITARRERKPIKCGSKDSRFPNGRRYTSGHLTTRRKAAFTYGRIEMRALVPTWNGRSKGLWPGFWMRPTAGGTGEIDIMEAIGSDGTNRESYQVHHTIHYDYVRTHSKQGHAYVFPSGSPSDGMHTYAIEWDPDEIRWYVDGRLTFTRNEKTTSWLSPTFDKEFFIRLNMAVGGGWPGSPTRATRFPSTFAVDYVRVYQRT